MKGPAAVAIEVAAVRGWTLPFLRSRGGASSRAEPAGFLGERLHPDPLTPWSVDEAFLAAAASSVGR